MVRVAMLWALAACVAGAETDFEKPAMYYSDASCGRPFAKDPDVVRFKGRYYMYYSMRETPKRLGVGIAVSDDLNHWEKAGAILGGQACTRNGLAAPAAIVLGDKVHLFYQSYGNGPKDAICHAFSEDGLHFERDATNPVFRPAGAWTVGRAIDAEAAVWGDTLLLYWATRDPAMKIQMVGVSAAPLDSDYGRDAWTQICDGPILKPELPWEKRCIEAPAVCEHGGKLYMFYAGAYNNEPQQIGVAVSEDGVQWRRLSQEPLLPNGPKGAWNASESGHPGIFVDDGGRMHLFFQGNNNKGRTWHLSRMEVHWEEAGPYLVRPRDGKEFHLKTSADWPVYAANPFVIALDMPAPEDSAGGLITADLDGDGLMDYVVTVPGRIVAYAHDGTKLWALDTAVCVGGSSERHGLPGHHGPGVQAGDATGDGKTEVLFLTKQGALEAVCGATGKTAWSCAVPAPDGAERWEHAVLASFRAPGSRDVLLQATNAEGYRMGRYVAAYRLEDLAQGRCEPLWRRDDFLACAHNGARVADLDGDGRDEVLGGVILRPDGEAAARIPLRGHIDSVFVYDVQPARPGLEVVALEEGGSTKNAGGNRVFLYGLDGLIWETHYQHWEPQNAAVGDFDPARPGLEIWCRSRFNEHQKPFVFGADGALIAHYEMDDVAPEGWTTEGVETIAVIDWTGGPKQLAAAKERHTERDVAVFDPVSGAFVARFEDKADRLYVADVAGDWREELLVLAGAELRIYANEAPTPRPECPRLWGRSHYRRSKMTWNYYSP